MTKLDLANLSKTLRDVQARWKAGEVKADYHLGYTPAAEENSLQARETLTLAHHQHFKAMLAAAAPPTHPLAVDWRQFKPGAGLQTLPAGGYVTPVKDQGNCGCCVAFGTVAAIESAVRIQSKNPNKPVTLSEADLFYCHTGVTPGPTCETGWNPTAALKCCQNPGIVDAACFPYTPGDQPCKKCPEWQQRLTKIAAGQTLTTTAQMKQWLASQGPLITCMSVYADFQNYTSGVYHHVSGGLEGGHCICCVGYDDNQQFWICKNSWNTTWGSRDSSGSPTASAVLTQPCGQSNSDLRTPKMPSFTIHDSDNGKTIEVPPDGRITLELKENPTTGYKWTKPEFDDRFLSLEADGSSLPGQAQIGGGGIHHFVFVTKGKGKSSIRILNKRPWDKGEAGAAVFEVTVLVNP